MNEPIPIDIDGNEDWIKTPESRESERRIHEELARQLEAGEDQPEAEDSA